ncbi:MAG: phospholipase nuclease [Firmicutes bacterium]|nr:phospholipase nuclease [Bacillota bacterium]
MPKDITHWAIATIAKKSIHDQQIRWVIDENYAMFLVGAVAYDIPYYSSAKFSHILGNKANELHGVTSCNVWEPIIKLLQYYSVEKDSSVSGPILSLVLGCITHVIIDSNFHPFIYYFTGNYYDEDINKRNKAVFKHRQLEAHLDLYYLDKLNYTGPTKAKKIVSQLQSPMIAEILSLLYFRSHANERIGMTQNCIESYVRAQGLFNNMVLKYVCKLVGMVNSEMRKRSALFYPKSIDPAYYRLFENNSQYCHPASGKVIQASLDKIYNNCIRDIITSFYKLACCKTSNELMETLRGFSAVSLETGIECASPTLMEYFSNKPLP